jgi:hypothetical protein
VQLLFLLFQFPIINSSTALMKSKFVGMLKAIVRDRHTRLVFTGSSMLSLMHEVINQSSHDFYLWDAVQTVTLGTFPMDPFCTAAQLPPPSTTPRQHSGSSIRSDPVSEQVISEILQSHPNKTTTQNLTVQTVLDAFQRHEQSHMIGYVRPAVLKFVLSQMDYNANFSSAISHLCEKIIKETYPDLAQALMAFDSQSESVIFPMLREAAFGNSDAARPLNGSNLVYDDLISVLCGIGRRGYRSTSHIWPQLWKARRLLPPYAFLCQQLITPQNRICVDLEQMTRGQIVLASSLIEMLEFFTQNLYRFTQKQLVLISRAVMSELATHGIGLQKDGVIVPGKEYLDIYRIPFLRDALFATLRHSPKNTGLIEKALAHEQIALSNLGKTDINRNVLIGISVLRIMCNSSSQSSILGPLKDNQIPQTSYGWSAHLLDAVVNAAISTTKQLQLPWLESGSFGLRVLPGQFHKSKLSKAYSPSASFEL